MSVQFNHVWRWCDVVLVEQYVLCFFRVWAISFGENYNWQQVSIG